MLHLLAGLIACGSFAGAANMKFLTSDSSMTCARGDFKLDLKFDGTGDNVEYWWNGAPGKAPTPVTWKGDVATFGLDDAVNGPFTLVFNSGTFFFQKVACVEQF